MIKYEYNNYKFPYKWNLTDGYPAKDIKLNGLKVFGTFIDDFCCNFCNLVVRSG